MYTIEDMGQWKKISNKKGKTLGISKDSLVDILEVDGYLFKDLNKNGKLDKYEDWRLPMEERLDDLVQQLSMKEIAGLMLYSSHQSVSTQNDSFSKKFAGTYGGQPFSEYEGEISDLTDQQIAYIVEENIRHFLVTVVDSPEVSAKWANNLQAYAEKERMGIPINISSDPRHSTNSDTEFNAGSNGEISKWPEQMGMAATFKPEVVKKFADIARQEYRALGITTALSPQIDLATEPRWMRFDGTFGEDSDLVTKFAQAYCDGFQTTPSAFGWGKESVNTMVKHWPGGGTGEAGRDAHFGYGKYAVYPGENFKEHLKPFLDGAFCLKDGTKKAAAVMPYYTISYQMDQVNHENVGNGFSRYLVTDLLREKYGYEGVVCTDWNITHDAPSLDNFFSGKPWGVEQLSVEDRHYKALLAGVDQFGGNNDSKPVLAAYEKGVQEFGKELFTKRFQASAKRLLRNIMQVGLFENPYVDSEKTKELVGKAEFMQAGFQAQLDSVVLLKNKKGLPLKLKSKVYIAENYMEARKDWFGNELPAKSYLPVSEQIVSQYYTCVETPAESEAILCFIHSPITPSYDKEKGYLPISLQYGSYTARSAREAALAEGTERSYKGKSTRAANYKDVEKICELQKKYPDQTIIVVLNMENPTVVAEFEPYADVILVEFGVQTQAILEILSGNSIPKGRLPFQMPKNMETVEMQKEDVPRDMEPYEDECGNRYDIGFGLIE